MKRISFTFVTALLVSTNASAMAQARPIEVWECRDLIANDCKRLVKRDPE